MGEAITRHSLRPLIFSEGRDDASLGHFVPRECEGVSTVIASEAKQSRVSRGDMDCFVAEPVIGPRVRADPLAPRNDE